MRLAPATMFKRQVLFAATCLEVTGLSTVSPSVSGNPGWTPYSTRKNKPQVQVHLRELTLPGGDHPMSFTVMVDADAAPKLGERFDLKLEGSPR